MNAKKPSGRSTRATEERHKKEVRDPATDGCCKGQRHSIPVRVSGPTERGTKTEEPDLNISADAEIVRCFRCGWVSGTPALDPVASDIERRLDTEPDFVDLKRFGFSLKKTLFRYPDGCPTYLIAQALHMSEEEVEGVYQRVVEKLKDAFAKD